MARIVDLTQPTSRESQTHPSFPPPLILPYRTHADGPSETSDRSSRSEILVISNHAPTHVDAISHFSPEPAAENIDQMPLDTFYGPAVCLDFRQFPARHYVTLPEFREVLADSSQEFRKGDVVLFCTDHFNRTTGTPEYLTEFSGIGEEIVHWLADEGARRSGLRRSVRTYPWSHRHIRRTRPAPIVASPTMKICAIWRRWWTRDSRSADFHCVSWGLPDHRCVRSPSFPNNDD